MKPLVLIVASMCLLQAAFGKDVAVADAFLVSLPGAAKEQARSSLSGGDARTQMKPKAAAEVFTLERTGLTLDRFSPAIRVDAENDSGQIECTWSCEWRVTLKDPMGNSRNDGGFRPGGAILFSGRPDMTPLFNVDGKTLWMIVGLERDYGG